MLRRFSFTLCVIVCICAILAFALPAHSGQPPAAPAALDEPPLTGGPDAFGYTWDRTVPFEWIDATDGVDVPWTVDVSRGPYDIGFPFSFYGQVYTKFYIAKGMLPLLVGTKSWTPQCIPSQGLPNGFIAGFWEDVWAINNFGHLFFKLVGSAPERKLVVEWLDVGTFYGTRTGMTFEIVLCEGSNDIVFQYLSMSDHMNGTGRLATVGIENQTGEVGLQVSCRQEWIRDESAVRIFCPGHPPHPDPGARGRTRRARRVWLHLGPHCAHGMDRRYRWPERALGHRPGARPL